VRKRTKRETIPIAKVERRFLKIFFTADGPIFAGLFLKSIRRYTPAQTAKALILLLKGGTLSEALMNAVGCPEVGRPFALLFYRGTPAFLSPSCARSGVMGPMTMSRIAP
jgi:hypothetical protein